MQRILVVEDDAAITRHLCPLLRSEGFEVEAAGSFEQARRAVEGNPPDLALVGLALPDGHGFALCPLLGPPLDVPVIFLTAAGDEASVVAGLGLGADDYVIKPFRPMELVSRIKGALRRRGRAAALAVGAGREFLSHSGLPETVTCVCLLPEVKAAFDRALQES